MRIEDRPAGVELAVRVIPRAGHDAVVGVREGALLLRLAAAPTDGAANDALVHMLAEMFGVPLRAVSLVSGSRSRHKRVRVAGLTAAGVMARLSAILSRG